MRGRSWAAIGGVFLSLALSSSASAQFTPGARSVGSVYYTQVGNGGYDAQHYDVTIKYDPVAHVFQSASTKATLRATQGLSEFSLDFVNYYDISSVTVNGAPATFTKDFDVAAIKYKLVITPAAGIPNGSTFEVVVNYSGTPQNFVDPDDSLEGFMRMNINSLGSFTMNEPVGAMAWFPNNNYPGDKATYDFHLTAPDAYDAIGNGELASKVENADDTTTWNWNLDYPMASYLSTSTIGLFDDFVYDGATAKNPAGAPLKFYDFIETALPAGTRATNETNRVRQDAIVKYMADTIGAPYPFDSHGVVAGRAPSGGTYALEVQTKSHFGSGSVSIGTLAHEIAHQWFGDAVGPASWREIWFNEGWATWWSQWWSNKQNGSTTSTASSFLSNYNSTTADPARWNTAPDSLSGPEQLFDTFPVYTRPGMAFEGYRQIVGDTAFFAFQKALVTEYGHKVITGDQVKALARRIAAEKAGFEASNLAKLDEYWRQWISMPGKPTLTPTTFFQSTSVTAPVGGTVPATLGLTLGAPITFAPFTPGVAKTYSGSTTATILSTAGDATLSVVDPSPNAPGKLVNGAFSLAQPLEAKNSVGEFLAISGTPLALRTYSAPTNGSEQASIELQQKIGSNDPLRTGTYSKTLTYTLSTTNP